MSLLQESPLGAFVLWSDFKSASKARVVVGLTAAVSCFQEHHVTEADASTRRAWQPTTLRPM